MSMSGLEPCDCVRPRLFCECRRCPACDLPLTFRVGEGYTTCRHCPGDVVPAELKRHEAIPADDLDAFYNYSARRLASRPDLVAAFNDFNATANARYLLPEWVLVAARWPSSPEFTVDEMVDTERLLSVALDAA